MHAEIIAVGTELLMGQVVNTNATYLSKMLLQYGIGTYRQTTVGDNTERLLDALAQAKKRSDIIVLTGGLGPTEDDLTKQTVAAFIDESLVTDSDGEQSLEQYFDKIGRQMTENNRRQALRFKNGVALKNPAGLAIGTAIVKDNTHYILLPGPPSELRATFNAGASTYLQTHCVTDAVLVSRTLRFFGIGESQLVTELKDLIAEQTNPTIAPYTKLGEVSLRLTANAQTDAEAEVLLTKLADTVLARVGQFYYGDGEEFSLPQAVVAQLQKHHRTVAFAESLTGGLCQEMLTVVPGASSVFKGGVVAYSNDLKIQLLGVPEEIIATDGAVSEACAKAMAQRIQQLTQASFAVALTGVAGPDPLENQAVGTVFLAIADDTGGVQVTRYQYARTRNDNRYLAALQAFGSLYDLVKTHEE